MALKKDKQKVLGEVFDDERIQTFLHHTADNDNKATLDYHLLERAYRGMKADNFSTFLTFFIAEGHDINTKNQYEQTFLSTILEHRQADDYIAAMKHHGAQ